MALPASGAISLGAVNTELGVSATAARSLNDSTTRTLFGVASGGISLSNGYGKANQFAFTIASNQTNANLRTLAVNAGWNQSSKVVATINGGVYISSNGTGTPALTVNGSFPGGVELVNNGFIIGMGGNGGAGGPTVSYYCGPFIGGYPGSSGGLALSVATALSLRNNGTIGGGGGGGGGGANVAFDLGCGYSVRAGAGGGGGRSSAAANSSGGAGTPPQGSQPGGAGTVSAAGAGGAVGNFGSGPSPGTGGTGGGWGSAGATGNFANNGSSGYGRGAGGGGGGAVTGNGNITWVTTGTRLGGIS